VITPGDLLAEPDAGNGRPLGVSRIVTSTLRANPNQDNRYKVEFLARESRRFRSSNQAAFFYRIGRSAAQVGIAGQPAQLAGQVVLGAETGVADVGLPDGPALAQMMCNPGSLNKLWDRLVFTRGVSGLAIGSLPGSRAEAIAAINASEQAGGRDAEVAVLKDILRLFNSLGGRNVKVVQPGAQPGGPQR
jgi:hypothetical protein